MLLRRLSLCKAYHHLKHSQYVNIRQLHYSNSNQCQQSNEKTAKYTLVYRFPYIVHARILARFKIIQTMITVIAGPVMMMLAQNQLELVKAYAVTGASITALGTLFYISNITRRLVGIVAIDDQREMVKISRLTFWGNRRDVVVPIHIITPLSEGSKSSTDIYTDLRTYDSKLHLYLSLKFGGVVDKNLFEEICGKM